VDEGARVVAEEVTPLVSFPFIGVWAKLLIDVVRILEMQGLPATFAKS
jgi:hypothetical protein